MQYVIYSKYLNEGFEESTSEEIYNKIIESKEILFEVRLKENIYNILMMNYYEFEKELFEISLGNEMFSSDYLTFNNFISKAEQRVLNLLSSITLYLDSFKDDLEKVQKYSCHLKDEYKSIVSYYEEVRKNDTTIGIMKFLRNHIQHNGLLNPDAFFNGANLSDELREETLKFEINKNKIKSKWFKLENFTDIDEKINLKKFIRIYIDFISRIHQKFRELTTQKTNDARNAFEKIFEEYSEHKYLYIAQKSGNERKNEIAILLNWDNIRLEIINKNHVPKAFERHSINTK